MLELFRQAVRHIVSASDKDSIGQKRSIDIISEADALHDFAQESLLLYRYKDVPPCWRLLVMDACLLKAASLLDCLRQSTDIFQTQRMAREIIKVIDTAMIVSGSPGQRRREVSHKVVDLLQDWLSADRQLLQQFDNKFDNIKRQKVVKVNSAKRVWLLNNAPDFLWFVNYIQSPRPAPFIVPSGSIDHWPARSSRPWSSMAYLVSVAGDRIVPVEIGSQYTDANWQQKLMRFEDFIRNHILHQAPNGPAYLAQHDLFHQIPRLADDINVPDYCYASPPITDLYERPPTSDVIRNAWFGPGGTISPLHHDPYHNFLAQVVGSKYIRLYAPEQSKYLYPLDGILSNTSQVLLQ